MIIKSPVVPFALEEVNVTAPVATLFLYSVNVPVSPGPRLLYVLVVYVAALRTEVTVEPPATDLPPVVVLSV